MRRAQRLRQRRDFASVYRRGRQYRSELLVLRVLRTDQPMPRFGFSASATIGNAVARNRVKRRLREAVRSLQIGQRADVVISARRGAAEAGYEELRSQLQDLFGRARLLEESAS